MAGNRGGDLWRGTREPGIPSGMGPIDRKRIMSSQEIDNGQSENRFSPVEILNDSRVTPANEGEIGCFHDFSARRAIA